jgi:hypothetical protein
LLVGHRAGGCLPQGLDVGRGRLGLPTVDLEPCLLSRKVVADLVEPVQQVGAVADDELLIRLADGRHGDIARTQPEVDRPASAEIGRDGKGSQLPVQHGRAAHSDSQIRFGLTQLGVDLVGVEPGAVELLGQLVDVSAVGVEFGCDLLGFGPLVTNRVRPGRSRLKDWLPSNDRTAGDQQQRDSAKATGAKATGSGLHNGWQP